MPTPVEAPYGTWTSPIDARTVAAHDGRPEYLGAVGEELWWTAPRPEEGGRRALIRLRGDGSQPWDEFGTTTGRARRVGWLDLVQLRYACEVNGFDGLVVTKLDVLAGLETVQICTAYWDGKPVYEELPGWGDLQGLGSRDALPKEVLDYLQMIEHFTGVPVVMFSTSPKREDTYGGVAW